MTCQQVQKDLSLYLYGELDFAREEELETHLSECAFCQRALAREKEWHTAANAERMDVPLDLLEMPPHTGRKAKASDVAEPLGSFDRLIDRRSTQLLRIG